MSVDDYWLRHLTEHLNLAKRYDRLHVLVEEREWYAAKRKFDPSQRSYAEDVSRSLAACAYQIESTIQTKDWDAAEAQLPTLFAHSLLYATIRSRASGVNPATLETLAKLGHSERAIRQIDLQLEPLAQVEACYRISMVLHRRGQTRKAHELLEQAASIIAGSEADVEVEMFPLVAETAMALYEVGDHKEAQAVLARLLHSIEQLLEEQSSESASLVSLAKALVRLGAIGDAFTLTRDWMDKTTQVQILCAIAAGLAETGDLQDAHHYLDQAIVASDDVQDITTVELLAMGLAQLGEFDDAQHLADKLSPRGRANILAVMGQTAAQKGDDRQATLIFDECLDYIQANGLISQQAQTCVRVAQVMVQASQKQRAQTLLLSIYNTASENLSNWRIDLLSALASALADADLPQQAGQLVDTTIARSERPTDDWERTEAMGLIAGVFAQVGYTQGLDELCAYAHDLSDSWQQAWSLITLAKAWAQVGRQSDAQNAIDNAIQAARKEQDLWRRALGFVSIAEDLYSLSDTHQADLFFQQAEAIADQFDSEAERGWVLAAMTRALADRGQHQQAVEKFQAALEALDMEEDPNFQAAAITAVSRIVTPLKEVDVLAPLANIARDIIEEFLAAEGLFSISHAMAEQDRLEEAWSLFCEAVEIGRWRPVPTNTRRYLVTAPYSGVDRGWALSAIQSIGWPSARAAASSALVSLLVTSDSLARMADLFSLVHDIPRDHSQAKALALQTIARGIKADALSSSFDWLEYLVQIFQIARQEDRSTVWSLIGAVIPAWTEYPGGAELVQGIWQKLLAVEKLLSLSALGTTGLD
jgi:tetratricopeptide (TPR) repeat protein